MNEATSEPTPDLAAIMATAEGWAKQDEVEAVGAVLIDHVAAIGAALERTAKLERALGEYVDYWRGPGTKSSTAFKEFAGKFEALLARSAAAEEPSDA